MARLVEAAGERRSSELRTPHHAIVEEFAYRNELHFERHFFPYRIRLVLLSAQFDNPSEPQIIGWRHSASNLFRAKLPGAGYAQTGDERLLNLSFAARAFIVSVSPPQTPVIASPAPS